MTIIRTDKRLRPRHKSDFYPTPIGLCRAALTLVGKKAFILDPGAGNGVWGKALKEEDSNNMLIGIEVSEEFSPDRGIYDSWYYTDYLTWKPDFYTFDLIMGNPPYSLAEEFVRKSLSLLSDDGQILFLLRLAFLEGQARGRGLWEEFPPRKVWACSRRPSFLGDENKRSTDDNAYGIFLWNKEYKGSTLLGWLDWDY